MAALKKDGGTKIICCHNKQKGRKSEVYHFEIDDIKRVIQYFKDSEQWIHYLMLILSFNLARRVGDMLSLRWYNFFDQKTGGFRKDLLEIQEDKTDKLANPHINSACRDAITLYIEKTGCDVKKNNYSEPVFMQLAGTHKGTVLSDSGSLKALKKAAAILGFEYNVGTHSPRKTFGMLSRMIHPSDYDSMELLQTIYNHSDTKTTKHYIGLTKQKIDAYYDDMGDFFHEYILGNKTFEEVKHPLVSIETSNLRDVIKAAYELGISNADSKDSSTHIDAMNTIMQMVEGLVR